MSIADWCTQRRLRPLRTTLKSYYISQGEQLLRLQGAVIVPIAYIMPVFCDAKNAPNLFSAAGALPQTPLGAYELRHSPDSLIGWGRRHVLPIPRFIRRLRRLDLFPLWKIFCERPSVCFTISNFYFFLFPSRLHFKSSFVFIHVMSYFLIPQRRMKEKIYLLSYYVLTSELSRKSWR